MKIATISELTELKLSAQENIKGGNGASSLGGPISSGGFNFGTPKPQPVVVNPPTFHWNLNGGLSGHTTQPGFGWNVGVGIGGNFR